LAASSCFCAGDGGLRDEDSPAGVQDYNLLSFVFILIGIALFSFGEPADRSCGARPVPLEDADVAEAGAGSFQRGVLDSLLCDGILGLA
jgi:hypothetical protein